MGEVLVEAKPSDTYFQRKLENKKAYNENSDSDSSNVTNPKSIGSTSGPISRCALTGTKKDLALGSPTMTP